MKPYNFLLLITLFSCQNPKQDVDVSIMYKLDQPSLTWKLPKELDEISGIVMSKYSVIIGNNDEEGKLFEYNLETKSIQNMIKFGKKGDYEDVAIKNDTVYVLRSDGTIFQINPGQKINQYDTFLSEKENTEGLFFDRPNNRLLIACKNKIETENRNKYAIYSFDLYTNILDSNPVFTISKDDFKYKLNNRSFAPSGLAINLKTNTLFIISSVGKKMIEMDLYGKIINEFSLNFAHFSQPEGIMFTKNGDLYISNEGKNNKATILKFNYLQ